jgi:hypothetical protein
MLSLAALITPIVVIFAILILANASFRLCQYERGVTFTLGRVSSVRGPGLIFFVPFIQQIVRVDLRTVFIPKQDLTTRDNASVAVDAVIYTETEFQAPQTLVNAATILASIPVAMQLRYLQTFTEIGGELNSTVVFPMPLDIVKRFLDILDSKAAVAPPPLNRLKVPAL